MKFFGGGLLFVALFLVMGQSNGANTNIIGKGLSENVENTEKDVNSTILQYNAGCEIIKQSSDIRVTSLMSKLHRNLYIRVTDDCHTPVVSLPDLGVLFLSNVITVNRQSSSNVMVNTGSNSLQMISNSDWRFTFNAPWKVFSNNVPAITNVYTANQIDILRMHVDPNHIYSLLDTYDKVIINIIDFQIMNYVLLWPIDGYFQYLGKFVVINNNQAVEQFNINVGNNIKTIEAGSSVTYKLESGWTLGM